MTKEETIKKTKKNLPAKNRLISKSDILTDAKFTLSVDQSRLIHLVASCIQESDEHYGEELVEFTFRMPLLLKYLKLEKANNAYSYIRKIAFGLMGKRGEIRYNKSEWEAFMWVTNAGVTRIDGELHFFLILNSKLIPVIQERVSRDIDIPFYIPILFKSQYSWRFYEWGKQYIDQQTFTLTVDFIRTRLLIDGNKYNRFDNLRSRVIDPALKEINEKKATTSPSLAPSRVRVEHS